MRLKGFGWTFVLDWFIYGQNKIYFYTQHMEVIFRSRAIDNRLFILTEPRKRLSGLSVAQTFSNLLISSFNTELGHPPRSQFNYCMIKTSMVWVFVRVSETNFTLREWASWEKVTAKWKSFAAHICCEMTEWQKLTYFQFFFQMTQSSWGYNSEFGATHQRFYTDLNYLNI